MENPSCKPHPAFAPSIILLFLLYAKVTNYACFKCLVRLMQAYFWLLRLISVLELVTKANCKVT